MSGNNLSDREEIISALQDFELAKADAELYLTLLQTGSATVNTISAKIGIDKGKAYRSIRRLHDLGFATSTFSNPTVCNAIEPEKALASIIEKKEEQILGMQKTLKDLTKKISQFKNPHEVVSHIPTFYIIQGRPNVYTRIGKLIEESTGTVYIVTTIEDLIRMSYTAIPEKIKSFRKSGNKVILITEIEYDNKIDIAEIVTSLKANEIRVLKLPAKSRMIVTPNRLMMSGSVNESRSLNYEMDSAFYTNSHEMVTNISTFCKHLMTISKPLEIEVIDSK